MSATAILLVGGRPISTTVDAVESQKLSIAGNMAALAFFHRKPWIHTLVELIRHISHDWPFGIALSEAAHRSYEAPLVIADRGFIERSRIERPRPPIGKTA